MRMSDQVAASSRRWLACLRTASSTCGVVNRPRPSGMKAIESTARTNRVIDPARLAIDSTIPRPAASSADLVRLCIAFMMVPLPSPGPSWQAAVRGQSHPGTRRDVSRSATREGCTQHHHRPLALRLGERGSGGWGGRPPVPRLMSDSFDVNFWGQTP